MAEITLEAKKSFGQNFLVDKNIIGKIIDAINPQEGELIIEVGPGQGALTEILLERGARVLALEKDPRMLEPLTKISEAHDNRLEIRIGDALDVDFASLADEPYKLVGNLPYNVGTQIVFNTLDARKAISQMTFMLQKEVVERIVAKQKENHWGRLAVWCDLKTTCYRLFDVPPTAFIPRPKITSSIVQLTPRPEPKYAVSDKKLSHILHSTFTKRRKMLRASLKGILSAKTVEACGINPSDRPEVLSTEDFCKLANALEK
jgi:16S rRNA (adenine1518-N6/adenine1519-N6)-dimethyltransferase